MIPQILSKARDILKARREDAKQVVWARQTLKEHQQKQSREDLLDSLTDEEVVVYYQDRVLQNISPGELLKHFTAQDLLASLPTPAILSAATYRLATQMEQQTGAMLQLASLMTYTEANRREEKPIVQVAGLALKRLDEIRPLLKDCCHVQRVDLPH